ncbi:MAG: hypothetical protein WDW38_002661 [Sanguina aurantia]
MGQHCTPTAGAAIDVVRECSRGGEDIILGAHPPPRHVSATAALHPRDAPESGFGRYGWCGRGARLVTAGHAAWVQAAAIAKQVGHS